MDYWRIRDSRFIDVETFCGKEMQQDDYETRLDGMRPYKVIERLEWKGDAVEQDENIEPSGVMAKDTRGAVKDAIEMWRELGPGTSIIKEEHDFVTGHLDLWLDDGEYQSLAATLRVQYHEIRGCDVVGVKIYHD